MFVTFDEGKRRKTLEERGVDMARAGEVFGDMTLTIEDRRRNYGETRFQTVGLLDDRLVFIAWAPREDAIRVISMRKANDREQRKFTALLGL